MVWTCCRASRTQFVGSSVRRRTTNVFSSSVTWLRAVAGPVIAVATLYGLFIAARLVIHGGDPSAFVAAGDLFADAAQVPANLHVLAHSSGYDGQAYYRLALEPWTAKANDHGIWLDNPAYRQQRILYPVLAWLLSLGRPALVPAALIAVNFLALCLIAGVGAALAHSFQRPSWWGALPALCPGFVVTLALDLTEIVELTLVLVGVWLLLRQRHVGAALCLTLAVLTRESALLVPVALALVWARDRLRGVGQQQPAALFAVPIATYVAWQGLLWWRWQSLPFRGNSGNIGLPLAGLAQYVGRLAPWSRPADAVWLLEMLALVMFGLGVLAALRERRSPLWLCLAWLLYSLLLACLGTSVWGEDIGSLRAITEWYVLGTVLLMRSSAKPRLLFVAPSLVLMAWMWLAMALL
jgi:hypothetical protein